MWQTPAGMTVQNSRGYTAMPAETEATARLLWNRVDKRLRHVNSTGYN